MLCSLSPLVWISNLVVHSTSDNEWDWVPVSTGGILSRACVVAGVLRAQTRKGQQRREGVHLRQGNSDGISARHRPPVLQPGERDWEVTAGEAAQQAYTDALRVDEGGRARAEGDNLWWDYMWEGVLWCAKKEEKKWSVKVNWSKQEALWVSHIVHIGIDYG